MKNGEKDVKAVPQTLDRLTEVEAQTNAAETLEVIRSPVQNMRAVMDTEQAHSSCIPLPVDPSNLDGNASAKSDREPPGMFCWQLIPSYIRV